MKLLVLGMTGLVGGQVVKLALENDQVTHIIAPVRKEMQISHPKLNTVVMDFENLAQSLQKFKDQWQIDAVICALGTTMKKAGSKEAFKQVDFDYPFEFAQFAQSCGANTYVLNSAMAASPNSPVFYSRVKGQLEHALIHLNYSSLTIVRPGIISGARHEKRLGETLALKLIERLQPILPKALHANPAENIAKAMLDAVLTAQAGVHIIDSATLAEAH